MTFTARFIRSTAAATAGLAGALALVAPANASAPAPNQPRAELTSTGSCSPTVWKVSWKLTTSPAGDAVAVLSNVKASFTSVVVPPGHGASAPPPPPSPAVPELMIFVNDATVTADSVVTETQLFPAPAYAQVYGVGLEMTLTWSVAGAAGQSTELRATATRPPDCHVVTDPGTVVPPPPLGSAPGDDADTGVGEPSASPSSSPSSSASAGAPASASPSVISSPSRTTEAGVAAEGSGGGLALTGAAAAFLGGGAALLVFVGAALFVIARRRRTEFTA